MSHPAYCERIDSKRSKKLFAEINKALKKKKLYRDPNFTAQQLSELLSINTRYIAAVVQLNTSDNFSNLLNSFRLADAERMLRTNSEYSAEEIGLMSGFGSRQSFYRVFLKKHGVTPRQFRIQNREVNQ
jgi:AraC-like DNA-binding protein